MGGSVGVFVCYMHACIHTYIHYTYIIQDDCAYTFPHAPCVLGTEYRGSELFFMYASAHMHVSAVSNHLRSAPALMHASAVSNDA